MTKLSPFAPALTFFLLLAGLSCPAPVAGADAEDILKSGRFLRYARVSADQREAVSRWVDSLRTIVADHQWEIASRTNEGRIWQGFAPRLKEIQAVREQTTARSDACLDSIRSLLNEQQLKRLEGALKKGDLLSYQVRDVPFHHISNSPLNPRFKQETRAYRVDDWDVKTDGATWSYADLLDAWTVTTYAQMPQASALDRSVVQSPDVQVSGSAPTRRSLIIRAPLIVSATLLAPDLGEVEYNVLRNHYDREDTGPDQEQAYRESMGLGDYLLVRLKMNTPRQAYYLDTDRYIIYLEDHEGVGYEPDSIAVEPVRKLEALDVRLPGQTVTYTDVFGTYTGQVGYKETRTVRNPSKIKYIGRERLIKLFFPKEDFAGEPVIGASTKELKLIIQPELEDLPRMELTWEMKKKPKGRK